MADSSAYATILAQIATMLGEVSGIGQVHARKRMSHDWTTFLSHFKVSAEAKLLGWTVSRRASQERRLVNEANVRIHTFVIRGIQALNDVDNSEDAFQDLVEAICDHFRETHTLNGTCELAEPIQVSVVEDKVFGSVLCHYTELTIDAMEYLEGGS
jgi:hypothetical protein